MRLHLLLIVLAAAFSASPAQAFAQAAAPAAESQSSGLLDLLPADAVTRHVLKRPAGDLPYTATAGTIDLRGQDGKVNARLFYTAYVADDGGPDRPVTFAFNGGPGAASAYLHLGLVGPRILEFQGANGDGTRPALSDNPDSWLDFTDLVLIDPAGTGWSRVADKAAEPAFYGVRSDAESIAKFIALYAQKQGRLASPKFLLGESYGGLRAAKVASALKDSQGILVSGIVMVSPLIEGSFIFRPGNDPLAAALQLPSLAAAELERKGSFTEEQVATAARWAMRDYLVSLAGPAPIGEEAEQLYGRIADLTGIAREDVARARGFVGDLYRKSPGGATGKVASPYDAAFLSDDPYPESRSGRGDDAILDGYTRAYGAAFAAYARDELRYVTEMTYRLLDTGVNRQWDWDGSRSTTGATDELRTLFSVIPSFRLLVAHGYSDALTPYGVSRYIIEHMPASLVEDRAELKVYRGGHMFYTDAGERRRFSAAARDFYQRPPGG
ncbi:S10 family peptidase [Rhizobium sp. GN54]|uniref:S10 family peptidase n=1 Tax=Rhizobium sp. GN54 TaxID=2898150 RepID=UPI001E47A48F|nr:carboxypeptidase [Rhizobium sp. GN54]MCD2183905.1 carboxypeptidase [Rhizobium sp. GN54]